MTIWKMTAGCLCVLVLAALVVGCGGGGKGNANLAEAIIFMRDTPGGDNEVWMMDIDGSDPRVVASVVGGDAIQGTLSPDGRKLLYVEHPGGTSSIVVKDLNTGVTTAVLTDAVNSGNRFAPAWSPDGTQIAYHDDGDRSIHVMNADGTGGATITAGATGSGDHTPAWNQNGTKIAYDKGWWGSIAVCNPDGSGEVIVLPETTSSYSQPQFLPDGRILAMRDSASQDMVIVNADGTGETNLTPGTDGSDESSPSVNFHGNKIAFGSTSAGVGQRDCFIGTWTGATLTNLTNLTVADGQMCWRPKCGVVDVVYFNLP